MIGLHNLQPRPGAKHRTKRLGCGESSGHGKTSGKGHKGQKARSGGSIRLGFEGGQMPLIRRLPKRGFNNAAFHKTYALINLGDLDQFEAGSTVTEQMLRDSKLIRGTVAGVKILGGGELKHGLTIEAHKVSASAREKIEKAGGTITLRETVLSQKTTPRNSAEAAPEAAAAEDKPPAKKTSAKKSPSTAKPKKKSAKS